MTSPESASGSTEILFSEELRDIAFQHLPAIAIQKGIATANKYYLAFGKFIEVDYNPAENEDITIDFIEVERVDSDEPMKLPVDRSVESLSAFFASQPYKMVGTLKRCYLVSATGSIDLYYEATGELQDDGVFVEDQLFPGDFTDNLARSFYGTEGDKELATMNRDMNRFTQSKLDSLLNAFDSLGKTDG